MKKLFTTSILFIFSNLATAQLLSDDLIYSNGNLTNAESWSAHSGSGNNPVQVFSNQAVVSDGSGIREDVSASFTEQTSSNTFHWVQCIFEILWNRISDVQEPHKYLL